MQIFDAPCCIVCDRVVGWLNGWVVGWLGGSYLKVVFVLVIKFVAVALTGGKEDITIEATALDELQPVCQQQLQLLAMLQHQWQQLVAMQCGNLCNIR